MDLKVNYSSLDSTASDIEKGAQVVRKQIDDIVAAVKKVTDGWEGEAHTMMLAAERQFNARAAHIDQTLKHVAKLLHESKADYHLTDKKSAQMFEDITF